MKTLDYNQVYLDLTKEMPEDIKEILSRRFGIEKEQPETLESIGKDFNVTRERIRQIQEKALSEIKKEHQSFLKRIYQNFIKYFSEHGGFKREDIALTDLGKEYFKRYVYFFLTLGDPFFRHYEKPEYFSFWALDKFSKEDVKEILIFLARQLEKTKKILNSEELASLVFPKYKIDVPALISFLEVSKEIDQSSGGFYGLKKWPEINPRGSKDRAYIVLKREQRPLHFKEIAQLIEGDAFYQTVHNELIKDPRFVLVGRGIYALREWGYEPGMVKDVIYRALKDSKKPLSREEIIDKVLSQRIVGRNTILMNLNDKNYFGKDPQGNYFLTKNI